MKPKIKIASYLIFNLLLAYLIIAFIWWEPNIENWKMGVRIFYVLLVFGFNIIYVAISEITKDIV